MVDFQLFFTRETTVEFPFAFMHTNPLEKGSYFKRKNSALKGSKFFDFRVDPFSEGI